MSTEIIFKTKYYL